MIIHFSILILILLVSFFSEHQYRARKISVIAEGYASSDYLGSLIPWVIIFGWITFLAAVRSDINDTIVYKESFNNISASWEGIDSTIHGDGKDKGFIVAMQLFKMYISTDYHMWFLLFAAVESIILISVLRRESVSILDACFFFFASSLYYNFFSMMRQWFAIIIVFGASRFIKNKRFFLYLVCCVFAAQFHKSAYFLIPLYFIVNGKAWGKKQLVFLASFVFGLILLDPILGAVGSLTGDNTYDYVIEAMKTNTGSSIIRAFISAVPVVLSYIYRDKYTDDKMINICVSASIINMMLNTVAAFTSGLYLIRMATYVNVFNIILYPYLLNIAIDEKNKKIIKPLFYLIYFLFYIFQMTQQQAFLYHSDILGTFK